MIKLLRRMWAYLSQAGNTKFNEAADPKIQLEQAITEAQDQHRRLKEHAANVVAGQHMAQNAVDRAIDELDKLNRNVRQAVQMADDEGKKGNAAKAAEYTRAAETITTQLVSVEANVAQLKEGLYNATQAADQAKAAVTTNGKVLQDKLTQRHSLLTKLEQARMQEQMNKSMASLSETVGQATPTLREVEDKIEARLAKARGMQDLQETGVESRMMEVEAAAANVEASARLDEIRKSMGIGQEAAPVVTEAPATAPVEMGTSQTSTS